MSMAARGWNRPLPPVLNLGGKKRFKDPLYDLSQSWDIISAGNGVSLPKIRSNTSAGTGEITLKMSYFEISPKWTDDDIEPSPPVLDVMAWDWMEFHCNPLQDLEIEVIQWVPDSRVICGLHRIQNKLEQKREITLSLSCTDEFGLTGTRIARETYRGRNILHGSSSHHNLVLSLSGSQSQSSGPNNQLTATISVDPGQCSEIRWILIWSGSESDDREHLEEVIHLDWEGEISHRKVSLAQQLQIRTGDPSWDYTLASSQRQAQLHFEGHLLQARERHPSRRPLHAFQIWQLFQALTPLNAKKLELLLSHHLTASENGNPSFPILAELFSQALDAGLDPDFCLKQIPRLERTLTTWFTQQFDQDQDHIPESPGEDLFWLDRFQPNYPPWQSTGCLESPALAALLLNDLRQIRGLQERDAEETANPQLNKEIGSLREFILASWNENEGRFQSRDYQTHTSGAGYTLAGSISNGWNPLHTQLPFPSRLVLDIPAAAAEQQLKDLQVLLHGQDWQGRYRIEELTFSDLSCHESGFWGITESAYEQLDYCVVRGAGRSFEMTIRGLDTDRDDLSLALPLWMKDLPAESRSKLINSQLIDPARYYSKRGLKTFPTAEDSLVQLPLNKLILDGLIKSGQSQPAALLFRSWLETTSIHLEQDGNLYPAWSAQTGKGFGKANQLESLLPVRSFLQLLGCQLHSNGTLLLEATAPHFFPVRLYYKGVEIILAENETTLIRPGVPSRIISRQETAVLRL